ncbi:MAG: phage tail sheath C-terminal domain-containing protein [Synechococcaceae cyanobacterium]
MATVLPFPQWRPGLAPGVYESRPPGSAVAVARLDRAVFLGLAARGPLHTAVDVVSWSAFERLFGGTAPGLLLPEAVRLFFAQGGRRCLVVRCLNHAASHTRPLALPGLTLLPALPLQPDGAPSPPLAARNPGAWASSLRLRLTLQRRPAPLRRGASATLLCGADSLAVGDTLSLPQPVAASAPGAPAPAPLLSRVVALEPAPAGSGAERGDWIVRLDPAPAEEVLAPALLPQVRRLELTLEVWLAGRLVEAWPQAALQPEHPRFLPRLLGRRARSEALRPGRASHGNDSESPAAEADRLWGGDREAWGSEFVRPSARLLQRSLAPTAALLERGEAWDLPLADPDESAADRQWRQHPDPDGDEALARSHFFEATAAAPATDQDDRWLVFADRPGPLESGGALDQWDGAHPLEPAALIVMPDLLHPTGLDPLPAPAALPPPSRCFAPTVSSRVADPSRPPRRFPGLRYDADDLLGAQQQLVRACERRRQGVALLDLPLRQVGGRVDPLRAGERASWLAELRSDRAAVYAPWLRTGAEGRAITVPPAAVAAGLIAACERERGVWRAPANRVAQAAFAVSESIGEELAGSLHEERVNAFRPTPAGFTLLGSRTTSSDRDWTHLSVRRLIDWLTLQIAAELAWAPFEPNDPVLWEAMAGVARRRLRQVFDAGGLAGATEEESFFARCDAGTTSDRERDAGRVVLLVGVAPVLPAEFLVFELIRRGGDGAGLEVR